MIIVGCRCHGPAASRFAAAKFCCNLQVARCSYKQKLVAERNIHWYNDNFTSVAAETARQLCGHNICIPFAADVIVVVVVVVVLLLQ